MRPEPVRLALVAPYAPSIVSFRGALIHTLVQNGAQVWVFAPDYTPAIREQIRVLGAIPIDYRMDRTGANPLNDVRTLWSLVCLFKRLRPDVVLSYNIKPVIYGSLASWLAQCPKRVAWINGLGYNFITDDRVGLRRQLLRRVVRAIYRLALRTTDVVCFQNPDDLSEMARLRIVQLGKARLVGASGVDLDEWLPTPAVVNPVTFTLAARLLREKGIVEFAQAAQRIKQRYPNTRFMLLGGVDTNPGALREHEVRQWVEAGIVEWHGHVPDVRPYFAQTSVYVLPSYYREGVPRSTQEAMAMARPVITTDAPGCRETVIDGVNGFLIPPRDVDALVRAMEQFIQQPELIITMGQASRKLAEERFNVHKINQRLIQVLGITSASSETVEPLSGEVSTETVTRKCTRWQHRGGRDDVYPEK